MHDVGLQSGRPWIRLRVALSALILVALAVPLTLVGLAVWRAAEADRLAVGESLLSNARLLAATYESVLASSVTELRESAEMAEWSRNRSILKVPGSTHEAEMSLVPRLDLAPAPPTAASWSMSNLVDAGPDGAPRIAVTLAMSGGVEGPRLATLLVDPRILADRLSLDGRFSDSFVVAIADGNGRILARSRGEDDLIGHYTPRWDPSRHAGRDMGLFATRLADRGDMTMAFTRIVGTPGWIAVVGEPTSDFDARWREPFAVLLAGSLIALVGAVLLALRMADHFARPVVELAEHARRIAAGERPEPPRRSRVVEFETLRLSQLGSHQSLLDRIASERRTAAELEISRRRYHAIVEAGALVTLRFDRMGGLLEADGWEALTGQPPGDAAGIGWLERIHPEDAAQLRSAWTAAGASDRPLEIELRLQLADRPPIWTRMRAVRIRGVDGTTLEWVGTLEDIDAARVRQDRLRQMALTDALTGLPNRVAVQGRLAGLLAARPGRAGALLFIDLDYFKHVNDTHGHAAGDRVLAMAAGRIQGLMGPEDLAGRLGGDEFAVVLSAAGPPEILEAAARRMIRVLSRPYDLGPARVAIGASVGIAPFMPGGSTSDSLFEQADRALYEAKRQGRNRAGFAPPPDMADDLAIG